MRSFLLVFLFHALLKWSPSACTNGGEIELMEQQVMKLEFQIQDAEKELKGLLGCHEFLNAGQEIEKFASKIKDLEEQRFRMIQEWKEVNEKTILAQKSRIGIRESLDLTKCSYSTEVLKAQELLSELNLAQEEELKRLDGELDFEFQQTMLEMKQFNNRLQEVTARINNRTEFIASAKKHQREIFSKLNELEQMSISAKSLLNESIEQVVLINGTASFCNSIEKSDNLIEKSNIPIEKSNIPIEKSNIPIEKSNIPIEKSNIPIEKSNIPIEKSNIPIEKSNIPIEKSNIPIEKSNIPIEKSNILIEKSNILIGKSNIPIEKSNNILSSCKNSTKRKNLELENYSESKRKFHNNHSNDKTKSLLKTKKFLKRWSSLHTKPKQLFPVKRFSFPIKNFELNNLWQNENIDIMNIFKVLNKKILQEDQNSAYQGCALENEKLSILKFATEVLPFETFKQQTCNEADKQSSESHEFTKDADKTEEMSKEFKNVPSQESIPETSNASYDHPEKKMPIDLATINEHTKLKRLIAYSTGGAFILAAIGGCVYALTKMGRK